MYTSVMMQGSSFAHSLLTGGIIYVHPLVTVGWKDSYSACTRQCTCWPPQSSSSGRGQQCSPMYASISQLAPYYCTPTQLMSSPQLVVICNMSTYIPSSVLSPLHSLHFPSLLHSPWISTTRCLLDSFRSRIPSCHSRWRGIPSAVWG